MCTSITREKDFFFNKVHDKEIKSRKSRKENLAKKTIFVIQTAMQIHVAMFTVH